jgi:hypothetical protein
VIQALILSLLTQVPPAPLTPAPQSNTLAESLLQSKDDLNPFPGVSRKLLVKASKSQELASNETLDRAWAYYTKFRGAWMPKASKPDPQDIQQFEIFAAKQKAISLPAWIIKPSGNANERVRKLVLNPEDPSFEAFKQTKETQAVKALCLVLMTEHELDRPNAAPKAAHYLHLLLDQTPFDPGARMLFAKMAVDAKDFNFAWYNVRIGIYLTPEPNKNDLEFMCFVGSFAVKSQWGSIQSAIRELAPNPELAKQVIEKQAILFTDKAKPSFTAITK